MDMFSLKSTKARYKRMFLIYYNLFFYSDDDSVVLTKTNADWLHDDCATMKPDRAAPTPDYTGTCIWVSELSNQHVLTSNSSNAAAWHTAYPFHGSFTHYCLVKLAIICYMHCLVGLSK